MSADGDVDSIIFFAEFIQRQLSWIVSDRSFKTDFHTGFQNDIDIILQALSWQAVAWNSVQQHAAEFLAFFKYSGLMSHQLQIISSAQAAGAAADDRDALAGGGWTDRCRYISCHIHSYTFDTADIDRIIQHVAAAAGLTWMFAYQRTGGWEWVILADQADCIGIASFTGQGDVTRNINSGRAQSHTGNRLIKITAAAVV